MSERNRVGLGKKKLVIILIVVLIVIGALVWIFFGNFKEVISEIKGCSDFRNSFSIEGACNLNENEVKVDLKRIDDNINLVRIKFEFKPSNSLWKVDGSKCLDVRLNENKYGNYCELIEEENENSYILNLSLGKQESVKVLAEDRGRICKIGRVDVGGDC